MCYRKNGVAAENNSIFKFERATTLQLEIKGEPLNLNAILIPESVRKFLLQTITWLKIKEQTTKPSTYKEYERSYRVDLVPVLQGKHIGDIVRADLQNYLFGIIRVKQVKK